MPHFLLPPAPAPPNLFFYSFIHSLTYWNMLACFAPVVLEPWRPLAGSGAAWVQCCWSPPGLYPPGLGRCYRCLGIDLSASSIHCRCSTHLSYFRCLLSALLEQNKNHCFTCWSLRWLQRSVLTCECFRLLSAFTELHSSRESCVKTGADNRCQRAFLKTALKIQAVPGPILSPHDYDS